MDRCVEMSGKEELSRTLGDIESRLSWSRKALMKAELKGELQAKIVQRTALREKDINGAG